jgi:uncharacterized membrane-anchored protein YitT (DUF2179 family)
MFPFAINTCIRAIKLHTYLEAISKGFTYVCCMAFKGSRTGLGAEIFSSALQAISLSLGYRNGGEDSLKGLAIEALWLQAYFQQKK